MTDNRVTRTIPQIVEEQVQRWRAEQSERSPEEAEAFEPAFVITVSRAAGTFGGEVARVVGKRLGLRVYDQEIVEHIATEERLRTETVDTLDERVQNRLDDYVTAIFRERSFDQSDYFKALTHVIMGLWGHGPCVLVGRGAHYIVHRRYGLSVRLIAPRRYRVRYLKHVEHIDDAEAGRRIDRTDAERASFIRHYYGKDIDDPRDYDLVLNVAGIRGDDCADIIADAFRRKFSL